MPFEFTPLDIPGLVLIEARAFPDDRGFFMERYKRSEFVVAGIRAEFVQDNHSRSTGGVIRGLHYQRNPHAQGKLKSVLRGRTFDVAVDLRRGSPTYGRWAGVELSRENRRMLWVPRGFANGFAVLSDEADVLYKVDAEYAPDADAGIAWDDPDVGVDWPFDEPLLSEKDANLPRLADAINNFEYELEARESTS